MDDTYSQNDSVAPAVELMIALFFVLFCFFFSQCFFFFKLLLVFSNTYFSNHIIQVLKYQYASESKITMAKFKQSTLGNVLWH